MIEFIHPETKQIYQILHSSIQEELIWNLANDQVINIGQGWRFPFVEEFDLLYRELFLRQIGDFKSDWDSWYWSNSNITDETKLDEEEESVFIYNFGYQEKVISRKNEKAFVLFIRVL